MKKKLVRRNKLFLSKSLKEANSLHLYLKDYLYDIKDLSKSKMDYRLIRRYGIRLDLDNAEKDSHVISVPIMCGNGRHVGARLVTPEKFEEMRF
ncbi:hypothetical protein [Escherichia coli]|uniref:hypothetical protein n=1 Tax=Escherichia coli TaxID=562 RepID=UPI000E1C86E6|nr:hypothetical protein [Escherichia coli]